MRKAAKTKTKTLPVGSRGAAAGFTLLELLIVLTIVGLTFAALSDYLFADRSALSSRSAGQELASVLRRARGLALAGNVETAVFLDLEKGRFGLEGGSEVRNLPADATVQFLTALEELSSDSRGTIRFFPDGSSTGGGVELTSGGRTVTVQVRWLTGQVSVAN